MASGSGDDEGNAEGGSWRLVGPAAELASKRCWLMYSPLGRGSDVCLFYVKGEFFAMDARCAHSGKKPQHPHAHSELSVLDLTLSEQIHAQTKFTVTLWAGGRGEGTTRTEPT